MLVPRRFTFDQFHSIFYDIWAIFAYFDPCDKKKRRENQRASKAQFTIGGQYHYDEALEFFYEIVLIRIDIFSTGPIVGHVGDGNFHVFFPVDHDNIAELQKVQEVSKKMAL